MPPPSPRAGPSLAIDPVPPGPPPRAGSAPSNRRRRRRLPLELNCHTCDKFVRPAPMLYWAANANSGDCCRSRPRRPPPGLPHTSTSSPPPTIDGLEKPRRTRLLNDASPWTYATPGLIPPHLSTAFRATDFADAANTTTTGTARRHRAERRRAHEHAAVPEPRPTAAWRPAPSTKPPSPRPRRPDPVAREARSASRPSPAARRCPAPSLRQPEAEPGRHA